MFSSQVDNCGCDLKATTVKIIYYAVSNEFNGYVKRVKSYFSDMTIGHQLFNNN